MDVAEHIAYLEADGPLLAKAAESAGWDAAVPGTEWTVRDLVTHVGGVHRWAGDIVRRAAPGPETAAGGAVGSGPGDDELLDWFVEGHAELVASLRSAPAELDCFTFLAAPSPIAFWARRQAHETAIHRADAQSAAGVVPEFDLAFAQDGMAEVLLGFAARKRHAIAQRGTIALRPLDGSAPWLITLGGEHIVAERDTAGDADVVVAGTASALYLWLWNRPAPVVMTGDESVAELWRGVRVRWS